MVEVYLLYQRSPEVLFRNLTMLKHLESFNSSIILISNVLYLNLMHFKAVLKKLSCQLMMSMLATDISVLVRHLSEPWEAGNLLTRYVIYA